MAKLIPLMKGRGPEARVVAHSVVDDADFERLARFRWNLCSSGGQGRTFYGRRSFRVDGRIYAEFLHQAVLRTKGVDHIDGDGLNNRRDNLRPASHGQNIAAARRRPPSAGYRGVHHDPRDGGLYQPRIGIRGRVLSLGTFRSPHEAAAVYNFAATAIHGEFARPNPIPEDRMPSPGRLEELRRQTADRIGRYAIQPY
jgi:hypothetical protein